MSAAEPAVEKSSKTAELWRSTGLHGFFHEGGLTKISRYSHACTASVATAKSCLCSEAASCYNVIGRHVG